jgi:hypothetical protein
MTLRRIALAAPLVLALLSPAAPVLAGDYVPLDMTAAMYPPAPPPAKPGKVPACRLHIAGIVDKRPETTMGFMGRGMVLSSDAAGWVRAGFTDLQGDPRWTFADTPEDADLILDVEIIKSYIFPVTTSKSANVVLRIRYSHAGGPLGENIYRGHRAAVNWAGTKEETAGLLNRALATTVELTRVDLMTGCSAAKAAKAAKAG